MQLPTVVCAWAKRSDCVASRSMLGVVPGSLQPNTPTESQLMSSTVMSRMLGRAAGSETASSAHKQSRIFFMIYWSGVRTPTVSSKFAQSAWSAVCMVSTMSGPRTAS